MPVSLNNNKIRAWVHGELFPPSYFQAAVCLSTIVTLVDMNMWVGGEHAQTPECK